MRRLSEPGGTGADARWPAGTAALSRTVQAAGRLAGLSRAGERCRGNRDLPTLAGESMTVAGVLCRPPDKGVASRRRAGGFRFLNPPALRATPLIRGAKK